MSRYSDRKKDKVKQRRFGKSIRAFFAALSLMLAVTSLAPAVSAQAATPAATPALATAIGDTLTKKCSTGGYSYETDSMFVVRKQTGASTWTYTITRSPNRYTYYTYQNGGGTTSIYHRAEWIHRYMTQSSSTSYRYPGDKIVVTSSRSTEDFRLVMSLTYATWPDSPGLWICDIYF
jgi:hypothetical protein